MNRYSLYALALLAAAQLSLSCDNASRQRQHSLADAAQEVRQLASADQSGRASRSSSPTGAAASQAVSKGLEVPAPIAGSNELILTRTGYTVSYNAQTRQPNWVAWQLTDRRTKGRTDRKEFKFTVDDEVPAPRAEDSDYRSSGYDRGHMCPAGDNKWSAEAMRQSFLFSNICPQAPSLNRGDWNEMELACRRWAKQYGGIYVVCGPVFYKKARRKTIGRNKVAVPDAFFKVLLCMNGTPKAIGFIYKNADGNRPMGDYVNTVDEVERITGIDFFPSLPDNVEKRVEAQCDLSEW